MVLVYYFESDIMSYLLSYLDRAGVEHETRPLASPAEVAAIPDDPDAVLLLSLNFLGHFRALDGVIRILRERPRRRARVILGGSALDVLEIDDLVAAYPEITHVCLGKSEEVLLACLTRPLPQGIYRATDFQTPRRITVSPSHPLRRQVLLTLTGNQCYWSRCRFCHCTRTATIEPISPAEVADQVSYYAEECGYSSFLLYDSSAPAARLAEMLRILRERGLDRSRIRIELFGSRPDHSFRALVPTLEEWPGSPLAALSWGVEFDDAELLERTAKGTTRQGIDEALEFSRRFGIRTNTFLLLGYPGVRAEQVASFGEFIETNRSRVASFRVGYFLLSRRLRLYADHERESMRVRSPYTVRDYYGGDESLPDVRTAFLDFDSWDVDAGRYVSRAETFAHYRSLFEANRLSYVPNLFFLPPAELRFLSDARRDH
jgi:hypothetical protein